MRFTPRNTVFYGLFARSGQNLVVGAGLLKELLGADQSEHHGQPASASVTVPPLATLWLRPS